MDDYPLFGATLSEDAQVQLWPDEALARRTYLRTLRHRGVEQVEIMIVPRGALKTRRQESGFHAMIAKWAKAEGHNVEDLKRDLARASAAAHGLYLIGSCP